MVYWTSDDATLKGVAGNQVSGFKLKLDGNPDTWYYLGIKFIKPQSDNGVFPFYLTPPTDTAFWDYWEAKGVTATATGWQAIMWQIINGNLPMFALGVTVDGYCMLIDSLQFYSGSVLEPLRLNGDYPHGTYVFTGGVGFYPPFSEYFDGISMTITIR